MTPRPTTTTAPLAVRLGAMAAAVLAGAATAQPAGYELVWADEFDGDSLDLTRWEPQIGTGTLYDLPAGWGNNELQYYTNRPENIQVSDGTLNIIARRESYAGRQYTSARLRTFERNAFEFGYIEARIKVPAGRGMWPAFWLLDEDDRYGGWAASGEIDIMETRNDAFEAAGTIHYGGEWPNNTSSGGDISAATMGVTSFGDDFHVYAIEWTPLGIRWFVDGVLYHQESQFGWSTTAAPGDPNAPFDQPMHLLLNVAIGGNYPMTGPDASTPFPQAMEVDWVRVYQRNNPQAPFNAPHPITQPLEAEDFDTGGQWVAYNDSTSANQGGAYRTGEGVDIEPASIHGFNVAFIDENEWIEYTIDVPTAGRYRVDALTSSLFTGGAFRIDVERGVGSGAIAAPITGNWQLWFPATGEVALDAGVQTIRFQNTSSDFFEYNVNRFEFTPIPFDCDAADLVAEGSGVNAFDVIEFMRLYAAGDVRADVAAGFGVIDAADLTAFLSVAGACP